MSQTIYGYIYEARKLFFYNNGQTESPTVTGFSPAADSIQAPLNSLIVLHVTDAGMGVDADTVTIELDGITIYTGDSSTYSSTAGTCRRVDRQPQY